MVTKTVSMDCNCVRPHIVRKNIHTYLFTTLFDVDDTQKDLLILGRFLKLIKLHDFV